MRIATILLGALGLVLGGLIALELLDAGRPAVTQDSALVAFHPKAAASDTAADTSAAAVALVLDRPLFSPTRTGPAAPAAPGGMAQAALPRLSGIMISTLGRDAVFMPTNAPPIIAREGARIGAFTVQSITAESVTVSGPHGLAVLRTSFASGTAPAAAAPPASPFGAFSSITGAPGSQWLGGKIDLPNPATWSGPPMVRQLPAPQAPPAASSPLLSPSGPPG